MKTNLKTRVSSSLIIFYIVVIYSSVFADGKLLRGEGEVKYFLKGKTADFYVSPVGNDNWNGKLEEPNSDHSDGPFATIDRARLAVQELKDQIYKIKNKAIDPRFRPSPHKYGSGRDILVLIREGTYALESRLNFTSQDGGERVETDLPTGAFELHKLKDYYVTYGAYPGERPVITGGRKIKGWQKGEDGKWMAHLESVDVTELFANGQRQTLARTPNKGFYGAKTQPTNTKSFQYKSGDVAKWPNMKSNRIIIVSRWSADRTSITKIDEKNNVAYLESPAEDMVNVPPKYYIENVEALLDTTAEWYYDQQKKILSYIPPDNIEDPNKAEIVFPEISGLIQFQGSREKPVRNLRFINLTFSVTSPGGGATISLEYAKNCEILGNNIRNISQTAISLGKGCYHNLIRENKIHDVRGSGIRISGEPRPEHWNDVVSDNIVSYNEVIHCRPAAGGIGSTNALRTTISHNYVNDTGSYGITAGAWSNIEEAIDGNNLVEYNHVSFTNMIRDDEGGIAVYGLSPGSIVRNNLIHDVRPAGTNENVGLFFQNMSSGWKVTDNIYYNLKQGEMKLCACYLIDNIYENNHVLETPANDPERIITGLPDFACSNLQVYSNEGLITGKELLILAQVENNGSTGTNDIPLYIDGKVVDKQNFAMISNNPRKIAFKYQFSTPGEHTLAIGNTPNKKVTIQGETLKVLYSDLKTSLSAVPVGESVEIRSNVHHVGYEGIQQKVELYVNGKKYKSQNIALIPSEKNEVVFSLDLPAGKHKVSIGGLTPIDVFVYKTKEINLSTADFLTYCSSTANPCQYNFDANEGGFEITARGTDFLHAEDSYGTIYLDDVIEGNFIATVQVVGFGDLVSEWYRAGIFVRNDLTQSNDTERGSLGSFLMFSTPKRQGAQWDEFGDGSMHNTKSRNYKVDKPLPVWLKLIRHGNRFTGYYSFDGKKWMISRESGPLPGLAESMDIGLAAGTNDQRPSKVFFKSFNLRVEK